MICCHMNFSKGNQKNEKSEKKKEFSSHYLRYNEKFLLVLNRLKEKHFSIVSFKGYNNNNNNQHATTYIQNQVPSEMFKHFWLIE